MIQNFNLFLTENTNSTGLNRVLIWFLNLCWSFSKYITDCFHIKKILNLSLSIETKSRNSKTFFLHNKEQEIVHLRGRVLTDLEKPD